MGMASLAVALALAAAEAPFGAISSAPLPDGSLAAWGQGGYSQLRAGYRQGVGKVEIGASAELDAIRLRIAGLGSLRGPVLRTAALDWSIDLSLGAFGIPATRSGSRPDARCAGLTAEIGSTATWRVGSSTALFAQLRLPLDVPLTWQNVPGLPNGPGPRVRVLIGGGAEMAVATDLFVSLTALVGPETRVEPATSTSLAVEGLLGFGWRIF